MSRPKLLSCWRKEKSWSVGGHTDFSFYVCKLQYSSAVTNSIDFSGDDSSNEDQGEERAEGDGQNKELKQEIKKENKEEGDDGASRGAVSEQSNTEAEAEEGEEEEEEAENGESEEFNFPDTTISLSHLQPSRWCHHFTLEQTPSCLL